VRVTLWGTRGSVPSPGPETLRYGGNTPCVEVRGDAGTLLVLDAGTGIRRLGAALGPEVVRVDILLTHLHLDHILGLGFFAPLERPDLDLHIWGPASTAPDLRALLARYLSPPVFPVALLDLPRRLTIHDVPPEAFTIGEFAISAGWIRHRGPTLGYRVADRRATLAYLPDHEPASEAGRLPADADRISGLDLARLGHRKRLAPPAAERLLSARARRHTRRSVHRAAGDGGRGRSDRADAARPRGERAVLEDPWNSGALAGSNRRDSGKNPCDGKACALRISLVGVP